MKRKKKLEKGINSLKKQIEIHEEKKRQAEKADMLELVGYYEKEIISKEKDMKKKKKLLDKQ